jgi:AcrR family transcriptional regulator
MARISKNQQEIIRQAIIDAAKMYFYQDGFDKTSTKKIAKKVGIAEGTIFNYFPTKADLFFETIKEDYFDNHPGSYHFEDSQSKIPEVVSSYLFKTMNFMLRLPKRILLELLLATMKMGKKHPERIRKFAELDFEYMKGLEDFFITLNKKKMIYCTHPEEMSQIVFGALLYELTMYLYEPSMSKEDFQTNVEKKIELILEGMMYGGNHEHSIG